MPRFRLTEEEAWQAVEQAHTSFFTTLRRDGRPITLPIWHAVLDRVIYLRTPSASAKLKRIRHDPRGYLLVESGAAWGELAAVSFPVRASVVEDTELAARADALLQSKYDGMWAPLDRLPDAVRAAYAGFNIVGLEPDGRLGSWNNRALLGDDGPIDWSR